MSSAVGNKPPILGWASVKSKCVIFVGDYTRVFYNCLFYSLLLFFFLVLFAGYKQQFSIWNKVWLK